MNLELNEMNNNNNDIDIYLDNKYAHNNGNNNMNMMGIMGKGNNYFNRNNKFQNIPMFNLNTGNNFYIWFKFQSDMNNNQSNNMMFQGMMNNNNYGNGNNNMNTKS